MPATVIAATEELRRELAEANLGFLQRMGVAA